MKLISLSLFIMLLNAPLLWAGETYDEDDYEFYQDDYQDYNSDVTSSTPTTGMSTVPESITAEPTHTPDATDCNSNNDPLMSKLGSKCSEDSGYANYCPCLEQERTSNVFVDSILNKKIDPTEELNKSKTRYNALFTEAYRQVTVEAEVQFSYMNIPKGTRSEGVVTCSPKELSTKVNEHFVDFKKAKLDKLTDKKKELEADFKKNCTDSSEVLKPNCKKDQNDIKRVDEEIAELKSDKSLYDDYEVADGCNLQKSYENLLNVIQINEELLGKDSANNSLTEEQIATCRKQISEAKNLLNYFPAISGEKGSSSVVSRGARAIAKVFQSEETIQTIKVEENLRDSKHRESLLQACMSPENIVQVKSFLKRFNDSRVTSGASVIPDQKCDENDKICNMFSQLNNELLNDSEVKNSRLEEGYCIPRSEYKMLKAVPEPKLVEALAKSKDPLSVLATESDDPKLEKERRVFLRSNPLIFKMISSKLPSLKESVANSVKKLSRDVQDASEPEKLAAYLSFLKKDLAPIYRSSESDLSNQLMCDNLAKDFAAIRVHDGLDINESSVEDERNKIDKLNLMSANCQRADFNVSSVSNLDATLRGDPLFSSLIDEDPKKLQEIENVGYESFNKKYCGNRYQRYASKHCSKSNSENCRVKYLGNSRLRKKHKAFEDSGYKSFLDKSDFVEIGKSFDEGSSNKKFKKWYEEKIEPNLSKDFIAFKGEESKFQANKNAESKYLSNVSVPSYLTPPLPSDGGNFFPAANSASSESDFSSSTSSTSNPGQVVPSYSSNTQTSPPVSFNPATLAPGKTVAEAIPEFKTMPPEEKVKNLEAAKQFMKKSAWAPEKIKNTKVDEELAEAKKKLEEEKILNEKLRNTNRKIASVPNAEFAPAATTNLAIPQTANSQSGLNPSSSSFSGANFSQESGSQKAAPPRVFVPNAQVHVKDGVVSAKEFKGPQTSSKDLIVQDPNKFKLLTKDPKALESYLKKEMSGMVIGEYKIITIINQSPNNPVPHLIFRVKQNRDGSFDIQSVPPEVPVRVATLKGLLNHLPRQ